MTNKKLSIVRRKFNNRLEKVTNMAQGHCGHEGPVQRFYQASDELSDWVRDEVKAAYDAGVSAGKAGGTCQT